ncbi:MAG: hypothetical protein EBQ71_17600 [Betaproteobacteria bacterium]|nr:hypothetical protein [Betaproteobacteria bacterium]
MPVADMSGSTSAANGLPSRSHSNSSCKPGAVTDTELEDRLSPPALCWIIGRYCSVLNASAPLNTPNCRQKFSTK